MKFIKFLTKKGKQEIENSEKKFSEALSGYKSTTVEIESLRQELKKIHEDIHEKANITSLRPRENQEREETSGEQIPTYRIVRSIN